MEQNALNFQATSGEQSISHIQCIALFNKAVLREPVRGDLSEIQRSSIRGRRLCGSTMTGRSYAATQDRILNGVLL